MCKCMTQSKGKGKWAHLLLWENIYHTLHTSLDSRQVACQSKALFECQVEHASVTEQGCCLCLASNAPEDASFCQRDLKKMNDAGGTHNAQEISTGALAVPPSFPLPADSNATSNFRLRDSKLGRDMSGMKLKLSVAFLHRRYVRK